MAWTKDNMDKEKQLAKSEEYPATLRSLMAYLWFGCELRRFKIEKTGRYYRVIIGGHAVNTSRTNLSSLTYIQWAGIIKERQHREKIRKEQYLNGHRSRPMPPPRPMPLPRIERTVRIEVPVPRGLSDGSYEIQWDSSER